MQKIRFVGEGETRFKQKFSVNGILLYFYTHIIIFIYLLLLENDLFDIFDRMTANICVTFSHVYQTNLIYPVSKVN